MRSETETIDQQRPSFIEQARRAQIIDCAIETIAELGFAQASLAQIAKRAGVSTGVTLYYFKGKEELIRAVVAHVFVTGEAFIRPRVEDGESASLALRSFIRASVQFIQAYPNYGRAVMNIVRSGWSEAGRPPLDPSVGQPRAAGFIGILEWGQRSGEFRPFAIDPMVTTIIEALDVVPPKLAADPALDLDAYADELVELFHRATCADNPNAAVRGS